MPETESTWILRYRYVADILQRRAPLRAAHLEKINAAKQGGALFIAGPYGDPPAGAVFGFRGVSRAQVEEFVAADPYVQNALVTEHVIEPWTLV